MLLALSSPALAAEIFGGSTFYFGDLSAHTGASRDGGSSDLGTCVRVSDGSAGDCGAVADLAAGAREEGLDFLGVTDHVSPAGTTADAADFEAVFAAINAADDAANGFVTIPGAEFAAELPDGTDIGQRGLHLFGDVAALEGLTRDELSPSGSTASTVADCAAISTYFDALVASRGSALQIVHHPAHVRPMHSDFACFDEAQIAAIEAYDEGGSSFTDDGLFDASWSGYAIDASVRDALDPALYGLRFGLTAGSNNHDSNPGRACRLDTVEDELPYGSGLTGIYLDSSASFDRAAIHDALVSRHSFATTGPRIPLVVEVASNDGSLTGVMGDELEWPEGEGIVVTARVPESAAAFVLDAMAVGPADVFAMSDAGGGVWTVGIPAAGVPANLVVDIRIDGALWFGGECTDGGADTDDHLWSSPIWLAADGEVVVPDDADGDGFTTEEGDCNDQDPTVYPGALEPCKQAGVDHDCDGIVAGDEEDCQRDTGDTEDTDDTDDTGKPDDTDPGPVDSGDVDYAGGYPESRCACSSVDPSVAPVLLLSLAALRRRRIGAPC